MLSRRLLLGLPSQLPGYRRILSPDRLYSSSAVPASSSEQFPDVLFLFGSAIFSFQHVQAAVDTLQVVLPDLVMETVNHVPFSDLPKPLTDFLVYMVPFPEMLVTLAAFCQFIEHILVVYPLPPSLLLKTVHRDRS